MFWIGNAAVLAVMTVVLSTPFVQCDPGPIRPGWASADSGHVGPVWGEEDGTGVIVFRWDEGLGEWGGSLYSIRTDGTDLTLLSRSVGDGRQLGDSGSGEGSYRRAFDTSPAASPDGTTVLYSTARYSVMPGEFDLVTVALDSGERRRLSPVREYEWRRPSVPWHAPAWSPDATRIAFLEGRALHTIAADGSDARSIAPGITSESEPPAWSPDGTRLAFRGRRPGDEHWNLYLVRADGSDLTRPLEEVVLQSRSDPRVLRGEVFPRQNLLPSGKPVWSPDGRRIAIQLYPESGVSLTRGLYVLDVEAGTVKLLASLDGPLLCSFGKPLAWMLDGAEVLFDSCDEDGPGSVPGLYAVTVDGEPVIRRFAGLGGNFIRGLAWSGDGARLAVLTAPLSYWSTRPPAAYADTRPSAPYADTALWTVAANGSDARVLVRLSVDDELVAAGETAR